MDIKDSVPLFLVSEFSENVVAYYSKQWDYR